MNMFQRRFGLRAAGMLGALSGLLAGALVPNIAIKKKVKIQTCGLSGKEWTRRKNNRKIARYSRRLNRVHR